MSFECKGKVIKRIFKSADGEYYIFAVVPIDKNENIKLNKYKNFTIKGNIGFLSENTEYTFVLEEEETNNYGTSYRVLDVPSIKMNKIEDLKNLSYEESFNILMNCTSSKKIAENILKEYPLFIYTVVTQGKEAIDTDRVKGMGEAYLSAYTRELTRMYKYYTLCHNEKLKPFELTIKEAKDLYSVHSKTEDIIKGFNNNPYYELIEICGRSLSRADKMLRTVRPDLIDSTQRTEALLMEILKRNEYDGNTRLNGSVLFSVVKNDDDYVGFVNLIPKLKDVAVESELVYFDDKSHDLSLMSTYIAECNVNSFVREKIKESPIIDDSLIEKYRNIDGSELSDEQLNAVRNFNKYSFTLLTGSAGCVDKDTEFFNGYEWKKISDYRQGDKVLQYTEDGRAELVYPNVYIKLPCDEMYLFKTNGTSQMLSDDHNMIFDNDHNLSEMKTNDFVKSFNNGTFDTDKLKFRTTFNYDSKIKFQTVCDNILKHNNSITMNGVTCFYTKNKRVADFVQFAFSSCGYRATINSHCNGFIIEHEVVITKETLVGLNKETEIKKVSTVDGFKYCFNVPSHMLVLRRDGRIFITGNCGKTFVTKAVIDFCDDNHLSYTLLAPTGSASLRLKESTGRDAMTIHLKCLKDGVIKTDVLLVDESSMVDLPTFNMMLNCIQNPDIRICLVGDKSQILPVGIGCVFADMINSKKVPLTELTKVFRYNDNGILYMATNTRQGRYCLEDKNVTHRKDDYTIGGTYHFSEVDGKDIDAKILERVTDRYFGLLKRGIRQKDILILSAYNVGECGVDKINDVIQAEVNPPSTAKKEFLIGKHTIIRVGDRVINIKNDYKALTMECYQKLKESDGMLSEEDLEDTTTIFNGQRGVAVDVLDDGKALVCNFDNEIIVFTKMKAKNIKLAYAISYHKSQGQESPYVISVVTPNQSRLLNRNLLYVGQTRGKKEQFDIGSTEAMKNALSIDGVERRDTWLYDLLREEVD